MSPRSVDFLVPVYNAAATLDATLASIAGQDHDDFRVILIDDGSTDDSPRILAGWQARDPRFEVIRQANTGIVGALNAGLAAVTAPFLARMDADDICFANRLTAQLDYLARHPDCVAVGCRVEHIDSDGALLTGLPQPGDPGLADPAWFPAREPYLIHPFLMARTAAIKACGGYRNVPHSEDSDLFWRLSAHGRLHNLGEVLGQYRLHGNSISGGSVLEGRIMAVGSRLGALSAMRRRMGKADIVFTAHLRKRLHQAGSLEAMCELVSGLIAADELPGFRLGAAIKLLELAGYRPYEVTLEDCAFITMSLRQAPCTDPVNRREIDWYVARTTARLLRGGHWRSAARLSSVRLLPRIAVHLLRGQKS